MSFSYKQIVDVARRVLVCAGLAGLAFYSYTGAVAQPATPAKATLAKQHVTNHVVVAKKPAASSPVTKPAPQAVTQVARVAPATTSKPKPAPVVVPSPSSNVSHLTPTSPPSSSPGSGSGSGSGSGGSSGGSANPAPVSYNSLNWAGYLATGSSYSRVAGGWVAPNATGNGTNTTADATWIGIGGVTSGDLIQVGTDNSVSASGQVSTEAFYEMLPAVSQIVPGVTVAPGDSISAIVTQISVGRWSISLTNNTNGESFSTTVSYASSLSSAEWIEEDPSFARGGLVPFDNFGSVSLNSGSTTASGNVLTILAAGSSPITLVSSGGRALATPSAVGADGASFSVTHN